MSQGLLRIWIKNTELQFDEMHKENDTSVIKEAHHKTRLPLCDLSGKLRLY